MKTLTIVCPAYNEAEGIRLFYDALRRELGNISHYRSTILFVVDGGSDNTYEILEGIATEDERVGIIQFSRNFGHEAAILAGIDHAYGDAVVTMDTDLQHPPEIISKLLTEFEKGADVVYTVREKNTGVGPIRRLETFLFYWLANRLSGVPIVENSSDFRLISQRVADIIRTRIRERNLFLRGILSWMGFKQSSVPFTANPRVAGTSKYSFSILLRLAVFGIISFSKIPLRLAIFFGACLAVFGFVYALYTVYQYFAGQTVPGYPTIVVLLSLFGGAQMIFLGIIGEYIGGIFDDVKARPHYLIENARNVAIR